MFNSKDIKTLSSCIANYIELANTQKSNLTIGNKDCASLIEFYDTQIINCYIVQKKINGLLLTDTNLKQA